MNPLLEAEHAYLGATIERDADNVAHVLRYGDGLEEATALAEGAGLFDVGGIGTWYLHGGPAQSFAETAFAGRRLEVGECDFEAALLGDGSIASVPLLARTGTSEYVCWDGSARADVLDAWLGFLSSVEQDGVAPFAGLTFEDAGEHLAALGLWGPAARTVLSDYLEDGVGLPAPGHVTDLHLDRMSALVVAPPVPAGDLLLTLVAPRHLAILWRSLLSFPVVMPVGEQARAAHAHESLPWLSDTAQQTDKLWIKAKALEDAGLVRGTPDYVGARGLAAL